MQYAPPPLEPDEAVAAAGKSILGPVLPAAGETMSGAKFVELVSVMVRSNAYTLAQRTALERTPDSIDAQARYYSRFLESAAGFLAAGDSDAVAANKADDAFVRGA